MDNCHGVWPYTLRIYKRISMKRKGNAEWFLYMQPNNSKWILIIIQWTSDSRKKAENILFHLRSNFSSSCFTRITLRTSTLHVNKWFCLEFPRQLVQVILTIVANLTYLKWWILWAVLCASFYCHPNDRIIEDWDLYIYFRGSSWTFLVHSMFAIFLHETRKSSRIFTTFFLLIMLYHH